MSSKTDLYWMQQALLLAKQAANENEVPVGAVLVMNNQLVGQGYNQPITLSDPSAHAELLALRNAATKLKNYRLPGTILYTTLEPCLMCAGALIHARVQRVIYGAADPKAGAIHSVFQAFDQPFLNHKIEYRGALLAAECGELMSQFFKMKRTKNILMV